MRSISYSAISFTVAQLCQEANFYLGDDVLAALKKALKREKSPLGKEVLAQLITNAGIAEKERMPLCQDCGLVLIFLEVGQEVHIIDGDLMQALNEGVKQGYQAGYLRKSVVKQPFSARINTGDNTPPVVHTRIVAGDSLKITVMPKGGGGENMSRLAMLEPAHGRKGIVDFVLETVEKAGGSPCPPVIVGVGIGGTADKVTLLAKEALLRTVGASHPDPEVAALEKELLAGINGLGIGPGGLGGSITALAVHAEVFPAHIASLPVAVCLQCHSARHKEVVL